MPVSSFTEASNQHVIACIQIDDPCTYADRRSPRANKINCLARIAISRIKHQADPRESLWVSGYLFHERWKQFVRKIIDGTKANIFQRLCRRCLPSA